jgi:hypothetical protein
MHAVLGGASAHFCPDRRKSESVSLQKCKGNMLCWIWGRERAFCPIAAKRERAFCPIAPLMVNEKAVCMLYLGGARARILPRSPQERAYRSAEGKCKGSVLCWIWGASVHFATIAPEKAVCFAGFGGASVHFARSPQSASVHFATIAASASVSLC